MIVPSVCGPGPIGARGTSCGWVRWVAGAARGSLLVAVLGSGLDASRGDLLAGAAPRSLARDHDAALEDLAAPDTPGLAAVQRARQARVAHRAVGAEALRTLQLGRAL